MSCRCAQVLKNFFELWFWDSKPNLVRRLMRLLLTRQLMESLHPCGQTYGEVRWLGWFYGRQTSS